MSTSLPIWLVIGCVAVIIMLVQHRNRSRLHRQ